MAQECVVGVCENLAKAKSAIRVLDGSEFLTNQVSLVAAGGRDAPKLLRELELGDDAMHDAAIGAENIWLNVHGESSQCGAGVGLAHTFQRRHNRRLDRKTFKC